MTNITKILMHRVLSFFVGINLRAQEKKIPRLFSFLFILGVLLGATDAAKAQQEDCEIEFGTMGISRTFSLMQDGEIINNLQGPWDFIRWTRGPCVFHVFNDLNLSGRTVAYGTKIVGGSIRIAATGGEYFHGEGWRARSLHIQPPTDTRCSVTLGDNGRSQTFFGPSVIQNISGWDFIRESHGGCQIIVFNGGQLNGRQEEFLTDIVGRVRIGWRIRSLLIQD
jgi:hypothetical protein